MGKIILPSIITARNPRWHQDIEDIKKYQLPLAALFLTGLNQEQRRECYKLLKSVRGLKIPFVHARSDMSEGEYNFLMSELGTKKFNLHPLRHFPLSDNLGEFRKMIYIENGGDFIEDDLLGFAGICLDFAHLENFRLKDTKFYQKLIQILAKYPIGANHLSAVTKIAQLDEEGRLSYDNHLMEDLSQFDYLKKYPAKYFGEFIAVELVNPIDEQLRLIKYLQNGPLRHINGY